MSRYLALPAALLLVAAAGCDRSAAKLNQNRGPTTLTVGFGLSSGQNEAAGILDTTRSLALERLVFFSNDGRPQARLAERWSISPDGLTVRLWLRPTAKFHDGTPVTATKVRDALAHPQGLARSLGPDSYKNVREIRAAGDHEVELLLNRRSAFVFEGLDIPIEVLDGSARIVDRPIGTGPFYVTNSTDQQIEMRANESYYGGKPFIDQIRFKPYGSVRAAWADMLRGQVDMLYEVGQDALESLQPSSNVKVFTIQRPYAYIVILNTRKPQLRDRVLRQALNAAIDRQAIVSDALNGHGTPADGPVWPKHWAVDAELPAFKYDPKPVAEGRERTRFTCIFADASLERLALTMQRQLQAVGVDVEFKLMPIDKALADVTSGNFDAFLADSGQGPNLNRPYLFWHSGSPLNWGGFASNEVDAALDAIRDSANDEAYKAGVAAFQRAMINDPPAIFLAWTERARAVSTRFDVPVEPGREILSDLRLWRPVDVPLGASRN